MFALLLVAVSLAASNFAAAIGIGLAGVDACLRVRVGLAFGLFEGGMPLIGLAVGRQAAAAVGSHANLIAGGLLIAAGAFTIITSRSEAPNGPDDVTAVRSDGMIRLLISGAALSIDNLVVGFALGTYKVSIAAAATIIAVTSVGASLVGLELGHRLGRRVEYDADLLAGGVLAAVGAAIAVGLL